MQDEVTGFLVGELHLEVAHHGHVGVPEAQLVHAEQALAQADVLVHGAQVASHGGDEVRVDLLGHLVGVECRLHARVVVPCVAEELELLDLGGEHGGGGVLELTVHPVEALIGALAKGSVAASLERHERAIRHLMVSARTVERVGERQVGVAEHAEDVFRLACDFSGAGEQGLLGARERVGAAGEHALYGAPPAPKRGLLLIEALHAGRIAGEQLCVKPCHRRGHLHAKCRDACTEVLVDGNARVLVAPALGVVGKTCELDVACILLFQEGKQVRSALACMPAEPRQALRHVLGGLQGGKEVLVACIHARQVPRVAFGHL